MLTSLDISTVDSFLNICKREIKKGNCFFVGYRNLKINGKFVSAKQALIDIGIMKISDIWKCVINLNCNDCVKIGRDYDSSRDMNSEVYVFKKMINGNLVYIKLTLNDRGVVCISFHKDY